MDNDSDVCNRSHLLYDGRISNVKDMVSTMEYKIVEYGCLNELQKNQAVELFIEGFGHFMTFSKDEDLKRKLFFAFLNRPLVYVSEKGEAAMRAYRAEDVAKEMQQKRNKNRRKNINNGRRESDEAVFR